MSGYQVYESTPEGEFTHTETPGENPAVIARMPDLDGDLYDAESDHPSTTTGLNVRQLSVPKVAMALTAAATVLFAGWIIFGNSNNSNQESWRQTPPAASAPEAPLWNAKDESKTAAIKLDEVLPQWPARTTPSTDSEDTPDNSHANSAGDTANKKTKQVAAKPSINDIRPPMAATRVAANRPLVIATPVPPAQPLANGRDWSTFNENEYYWAVRQCSTPATNARSLQHGNNMAGNYRQPFHVRQDLSVQKAGAAAKPVFRTANLPASGYRDSDLAAKRAKTSQPNNQASPQKTAPAARLNGVIETPNARIY